MRRCPYRGSWSQNVGEGTVLTLSSPVMCRGVMRVSSIVLEWGASADGEFQDLGTIHSDWNTRSVPCPPSLKRS